jgi:hypothetical protein
VRLSGARLSALDSGSVSIHGLTGKDEGFMVRVMENPHYDKIQSLAAELNALWMQAGAAKIH